MTIHHTPGHLCQQPALPSRRPLSLATALLSLAALLGAGAAQAAACSGITVLHAAPAAAGAADGSSWANASTLQAALAQANTNTDPAQCQEIRVKQEVYKPTETLDRTISFAINRPLRLLGGYTGNPSQREERELNAHNTVLSGDIDNNDLGTDTNGGITAVARFNANATEATGNQLKGSNGQTS